MAVTIYRHLAHKYGCTARCHSNLSQHGLNRINSIGRKHSFTIPASAFDKSTDNKTTRRKNTLNGIPLDTFDCCATQRISIIQNVQMAKVNFSSAIMHAECQREKKNIGILFKLFFLFIQTHAFF